MRYLIDIRLEGKSRLYPIDADNETQAVERLKLRLPPHQRESIIIDSIEIDPASIPNDDPFGIFLH
ncbi:hypothetical protein [Sulfuricurvum sp.]|uniref:hypothetical protein n=1 Tax=Sulfuricurvum sp. TaxID=2025608 RepID=UPI002611DF73|nr:hypothetical protein [Sulfuricurvum sp.]MDD2782309.1 hypothetical protein [Sulfuricurvum sp.]